MASATGQVAVLFPPLAAVASAGRVPLERAVVVDVVDVVDDRCDESRTAAAASLFLPPVSGRRLQRQVARQRERGVT